jgi:DNA-directed RNA polymerase specialized sigma24 family protein
MRNDSDFSEFVAARQTHLRRIAYALCGDWHKADDLLQTALTKLYVAWPRIRQQGGEEAYCRQIMVRANIDESRRP